MTTLAFDDRSPSIYKLFLLDQDHKLNTIESCDQIINTYEKLMLEDDLFPEQDSMRRGVILNLCGLPETYWERSLPLIQKAIETYDIYNENRKRYHFSSIVNALAQEGNLEGIKLIFPPQTTKDQLISWYKNETIKSAPYALFDTPRLLTGKPYVMSNTKSKYSCLEYLLQLLPENHWQELGCHKENNPFNRWRPLMSRAADTGDNELILWLHEHGHPVNVHQIPPYDSKNLYSFSTNVNPLTCAIANHHTQTAHLLFKLGCNSHCPPYELRHPLEMVICLNNDNYPEELQTLIQPLINTWSDLSGKLVLAAEVNNVEAIELLINAGGNIEETNSVGETPLMVSFNNSHLESFRILYLASVELYDTGRSTTDPASIVEQLIHHNPAAPSIEAWLESYHLDKNTANIQNKTVHKKLRL